MGFKTGMVVFAFIHDKYVYDQLSDQLAKVLLDKNSHPYGLRYLDGSIALFHANLLGQLEATEYVVIGPPTREQQLMLQSQKTIPRSQIIFDGSTMPEEWWGLTSNQKVEADS